MGGVHPSMDNVFRTRAHDRRFRLTAVPLRKPRRRQFQRIANEPRARQRAIHFGAVKLSGVARQIEHHRTRRNVFHRRDLCLCKNSPLSWLAELQQLSIGRAVRILVQQILSVPIRFISLPALAPSPSLVRGLARGRIDSFPFQFDLEKPPRNRFELRLVPRAVTSIALGPA